MSASLTLDLVIAASALVAPQSGDCRAIADPAARLACYDARDAGQPAAPARPVPSEQPVPSIAPAAPAPVLAPVPAPSAPASTATTVRADPEGRIVAVAPLRYGLFRLTLDDGRAFDTTTNTQAPPAVGTAVRLRRTPLGTTFIDVAGRDPITVRLARRTR